MPETGQSPKIKPRFQGASSDGTWRAGLHLFFRHPGTARVFNKKLNTGDFARVLPCFAPGFGMTLDHSSGIICHEPAQNPDHTFRETLCMGYTRYSPREVGRLATRTWKSVCFQVEDGP